MTYLEMFIVVMAIVLLSTVAIMHHRTMATAADLVTNASHAVQATQVALEFLDSLDAKLMASNKTDLNLEKIAETYADYQETLFLEHYLSTFDLEVTTLPCDVFGNTEAEIDQLTNLLVTVRVQENPPGGASSGQRHPVTQTRVYTIYTLENL
jgi:hypothetical protein